MKIALNGMLLGGYFSGVEVTIRELVQSLCHTPIELHLFIPDYSDFSFNSPKLYIHRIKLPKTRTARILWEHSRLNHHINKLNCNLLHCPGYIAPIKLIRPTILTVHDCFAVNHPKWCKLSNHLYYKMFMTHSVKQATKIITPTVTVKEEVISTFNIPDTNVDVIPFAPAAKFAHISDPTVIKRIQTKYNLPPNYILHVGNHEPKKNIDGILKAFKLVKENYSQDLKLVLAGSNAWGVNTTSLISTLGLTENVIIPGYIPLDDLPSIYSLAKCLFFPSFGEGFGIPVLEAMKCKTPVICSNIEALNEISTKNSALKVDPTDPRNMADCIITLLNSDKLQSELISNGLNNSNQFTWAKTAKMTMDVYRKVLQ